MDAFNSGRSRVLVGQVIAAGVGLTLHGNGKNHRVIIAQLPWTPADLKQAEDRLHRIGQTHDVIVEVCLAAIEDRWTIDERLWNMLEAKNFTATTVTDGVGEFLLTDIVEGVLDTYRS
jgi:SNF2 family DNA or RNA helicase